MNELESRLFKIIAEQFGYKIDQVKLEMNFIEDFGGDSLDTVELVLSVEDEFGIDIPEEIAEKLDTVRKVLDYIHNYTKD